MKDLMVMFSDNEIRQEEQTESNLDLAGMRAGEEVEFSEEQESFDIWE